MPTYSKPFLTRHSLLFCLLRFPVFSVFVLSPIFFVVEYFYPLKETDIIGNTAMLVTVAILTILLFSAFFINNILYFKKDIFKKPSLLLALATFILWHVIEIFFGFSSIIIA